MAPQRAFNPSPEAHGSFGDIVHAAGVANLRCRASDRLAVSKLVSQLTRSAIKSPLAQCLLVRYVSQVSKQRLWLRAL